MKIIALILLQFTSIQNELLSSLKSFQAEEGIKQGIVTAAIHRLSDNKKVLGFNEEKAVNSASTLKLISTATILERLGSDFRYETDLMYSGQIENNMLLGDLIIFPSGDPSFGSDRSPNTLERVMEDISSTLISLGIKEIKGNIIINDPGFYNYDMPDSWIWADMGNYYGAIPHQFNINENYYTIYFEPGNSIGDKAEVSRLHPFDEDWKIINLVTTAKAGSGDQVYIYGSPTSETILLKGTVPMGESHFPVKGSIANPSKLFRANLLTKLKQENITVTEENLSPSPDDLIFDFDKLHLLKRFQSQPLEELVIDCNYSSINLYADAFLQSQYVNDKGLTTFNESLDSLKSFWRNKGLPLSGFMPKDGSGLSASGLITVENMCNILWRASKNSTFHAFYASIPVLGKDGTVKFKDRSNITEGRVRSKSGSIESTRAYAGYFSDKLGVQYSFMICINRYEEDASDKVRVFLDEFLVKMGSR